MTFRSFSTLARPYRLLEHLTFGRALHRARTRHLAGTAACRYALVLGDGDGRFLAALLRHHPDLHVLAVDSSPGMLAALRRRCLPLAPGRLHTLLSDARFLPLPPQPRFDLVCTHFFLDCLSTTEVHALARHLRPHLQPGALWLLSDFCIPSRPWPLHLAARLLLRVLYLAFRWLTGLQNQQLPDYPAALAAAGLHLQSRHLSLGGLLTAEVWRLAPSSQPHPKAIPAAKEPAVSHPDRPHIEIAYDIDPLTPLGPTPDPLPVNELDDHVDNQRESPAGNARPVPHDSHPNHEPRLTTEPLR